MSWGGPPANTNRSASCDSERARCVLKRGIKKETPGSVLSLWPPQERLNAELSCFLKGAVRYCYRTASHVGGWGREGMCVLSSARVSCSCYGMSCLESIEVSALGGTHQRLCSPVLSLCSASERGVVWNGLCLSVGSAEPGANAPLKTSLLLLSRGDLPLRLCPRFPPF